MGRHRQGSNQASRRHSNNSKPPLVLHGRRSCMDNPTYHSNKKGRKEKRKKEVRDFARSLYEVSCLRHLQSAAGNGEFSKTMALPRFQYEGFNLHTVLLKTTYDFIRLGRGN
eukprot:14148584-Ditylum_brightwellii.AAC.1